MISMQLHHTKVTTKPKTMINNQLTLETANQHLKVLIAAEDTEEESIVDRSSESLKETAHQCEVVWDEEALMLIEAATIWVVEEALKHQAEVGLKRQAEEVSSPKASEAHHQCHSKTK